MNRSPLLLIILLIFSSAISADGYQERRVIAGVKLFHALVAADLDLSAKLDAEGRVDLAVLYRQDPDAAGQPLEWLQTKAVAGMQMHAMRARTLALDRLTHGQPPSALYIAERLSAEQLRTVIDYAAVHHRVLYSPFEGDVEAGVTAGLSVQARVRPYLNRTALLAAGLNIKPFFLKIARLHE